MSYNKPKLSVIITTYNQPKWLSFCLESYRHQSEKDFEIIIADDGSSEETKLVIESYKDIISKHVWHPDNGFEKTKILNKAIVESKSEYLLFTDGDCIAPFDLVETHLSKRKINSFLSGSYYKLEKKDSDLVTNELIIKCLFSFNALKKINHKISFKAVKFLAPIGLRIILDKITPTKATWNGHCSSGWKKDIERVNGFDERMVYGGLDRELGERLVNLGIKPIQIRNQSCVLHLFHKQSYITQEGKNNNYQIRAEVKNKKIIWSEFGIKKKEI